LAYYRKFSNHRKGPREAMIVNDIKNICLVGAGNMGHQIHNASVGSKDDSK